MLTDQILQILQILKGLTNDKNLKITIFHHSFLLILQSFFQLIPEWHDE